jgi:hypothetical protein
VLSINYVKDDLDKITKAAAAVGITDFKVVDIEGSTGIEFKTSRALVQISLDHLYNKEISFTPQEYPEPHTQDIIAARKEAYANGCHSLQIELRQEIAVLHRALELAVVGRNMAATGPDLSTKYYISEATKQLDPEYYAP